MGNGLSTQRTQTQANQRLPWHKPGIQCLIVSLDTGSDLKPGSAADGPGAFDRIVGPVED
jgi:hypothetical protein